MKILVPYKDIGRRRIDDPVVSGGIERFIRNLLDNVDGVEVIDVTDIYFDPELVARIVGERAKDCDLVICNYPNEGLNVKLRERTTTPIAWIVHHTFGLDPNWERVSENMLNMAREPGCSIWMVSRSQMIKWDQMACGGLIAPLVRGFVRPGFSRPNGVVSRSYDVATLGRCQRMKDPFLLHRVGERRGWHTVVMTNSANDHEYEYENKDWVHPQDTVWNAPDDEVTKRLARAGCFLVTWPGETFGIAALEALSLGVPIVMTSQTGEHACTELVTTIDHGVVVDQTDEGIAEAAEIYMRWNLQKRREIASVTDSLFGLPQWKLDMKHFTERAVQ